MEALAHTGNGEARIFFSTVTNLSQHFEPHPVYRKNREEDEEELVGLQWILTARLYENNKKNFSTKYKTNVIFFLASS